MIRRLRRALRKAADGTAGADSGRASAFAVVLCVALFAVAGLVLDGGLAIAAKVQAFDVAQSAARAGAQELNLTLYRTRGVAELDPGRAAATARAWLASAGVQGTATATTTTVTVTAHRTTSTQLLRAVGVGQLRTSATASATAVHGVTGPNT